MFSLFKVKLSNLFTYQLGQPFSKMEPEWRAPEGLTSCFSLGSSGLLDPVSVCVRVCACACAHVCVCRFWVDIHLQKGFLCQTSLKITSIAYLLNNPLSSYYQPALCLRKRKCPEGVIFRFDTARSDECSKQGHSHWSSWFSPSRSCH